MPGSAGPTDALELRLVQLWFGRQRIAGLTAETAEAEQCAAGWRQRFPSLRITNELCSLAPEQRS
jgi:hypothetical protein